MYLSAVQQAPGPHHPLLGAVMFRRTLGKGASPGLAAPISSTDLQSKASPLFPAGSAGPRCVCVGLGDRGGGSPPGPGPLKTLEGTRWRVYVLRSHPDLGGGR